MKVAETMPYMSHPRSIVYKGSDANFAPNEGIAPCGRITNGPFAQLKAIFVSNDGDERAVLLLDILQKNRELSFPVGYVRRVS